MLNQIPFTEQVLCIRLVHCVWITVKSFLSFKDLFVKFFLRSQAHSETDVFFLRFPRPKDNILISFIPSWVACTAEQMQISYLRLKSIGLVRAMFSQRLCINSKSVVVIDNYDIHGWAVPKHWTTLAPMYLWTTRFTERELQHGNVFLDS